MNTPAFFNLIPSIRMFDPLAEVLGAAENGLMEYSYQDTVKLAGHSCPTVAGAFLMVRSGLKSLYEEEIPVRGEIKVLMKGKLGEGIVGVVANVASMITGATESGGFHGLGKKFDRRNLLSYDAVIEGEMALERIDTNERVILSYDPSIVAVDPQMGTLLPLILSNRADKQECDLFGTLWQERVRKLLIDFIDDERLIQCKKGKGENK
ncbi:MAG: hypothetical protein PHQ90_07055 [Sulfuricurvum sp.]|uniref:hypothetical protein n=1 Tax=Sulfuricurvum sp. TaxID=2025608 RepID=UPI00263133AD|nr:hypothetical protein [Sulfuricurvum sp.]MDD2369045.1 hypothetical protein [Sulfuricurvum sp.]MDD2950714.1 hypothetical protein [Sulfuricurvum sp.]MDD5118025.1 hypothetical protein [Sulfuricurvum sp.]